MQWLLKIVLATLCLVTIVTCNQPHLANVSNKSIRVGTIIIKATNGIRGPVELIIDNYLVPVECTDKKRKYSSLEITGLTSGVVHNISLASAKEVFGPDQLDLILDNNHGEYRIIFSKPFQTCNKKTGGYRI